MSIDPKILKRMQGEDSFLQSQTRGSRRVKLNRGQNWIVRFLPAQMGPDGLFFARIARHWLNKLPIVCPRNTATDFGGDPDCDCPVCSIADELNDSADEIISKFGYKAKSNPQFLTYCIVWEKDGIAQPMSEILNPYEFWHYRSTWEELKGFYIAGGRKCTDSVLDYAQGNDFSVNKTAKGMRLDKQDSSPIFDPKEPKYDEWLKKIEAALKTPKVTIPTHEQMQVFAAKVQEAANRGGVAEDEDAPRGRRPRHDDDEAAFRPRRGAAPVDEEEDNLPYDPPARPAARAAAEKPAAAAPARRSAPEPEDDGGDQEPAPRRRTAPVDEEPAPRRRAPVAEEEPAPRRRAPVEAEEPPPRRRTAPEPVEEAEAPAPRRAAPTARRAAEEPEPEPDPVGDEPEPEAVDAAPRASAKLPNTARKTLEPTARRQSEAAASAPQSEAEEEDPLPEDDRDPVPPAAKRTVAEDEDAPPPVARKGGGAASITARLAKLPRGA